MSLPTIEEAVATIKTFPKAEFTNEHGEKFVIYSNGMGVYMAGDEVDQMVSDDKKVVDIIPLFGEAFNVWDKDEIYKLGTALQTLAIENGYKVQR